MLSLHWFLGSYTRKVSRFIALNDFCREKFLQAGLPADKVVVKPNFVEVADCPALPRAGGLFVGRLSREKGTAILAGAARLLEGRVPIDVVGAGPEEASLRSCPGLNVVGWEKRDAVLARMRRARFLIMPSIWYENFPLTLVEAFACGLPVLASRRGALERLVEHSRTGLLFAPGSAVDLANAIEWCHQNGAETERMGREARRTYEEKYTPRTNYQVLQTVYAGAIASNGRSADRRQSHSSL
jgi:glycosyltransferase involved in cell wall biosynthesis